MRGHRLTGHYPDVFQRDERLNAVYRLLKHRPIRGELQELLWTLHSGERPESFAFSAGYNHAIYHVDPLSNESRNQLIIPEINTPVKQRLAPMEVKTARPGAIFGQIGNFDWVGSD